VLVIENLCSRYGRVEALHGVSLAVAEGEIVTLVGSNGAGKTTLLRTISGLKEPKNGSVRMGEHSLVGKRTEDIARLGIGHVPEGRGVIGEFTVEENLRLGAMTAKVNLHQGLEEQYVQFPVLGERRKQHAAKLSGGERQMLAMARALIAKPTVLLLDEPSLGLAPLVTAQLMHTIRSLCETSDLTVILVEQNASSALRIAHNAVVLHVGKAVANDTAANVAANENLRQYYLGLVE
jgi:branched-chain amino acid transport system ATP-binding protein